jgi:hypothetical protein
MRWGWLRDFAAVTTEADMSLTRFIARTHGAASAVGYGKSAMLFHMVRNEIGAQAFDQSLRDLWASHAHRRAGWSDLQAAFERRAGRSLAGLFAPMLTRTGASSATPVSAQWQPGSSGVQMSFAAPMPYTLSLPAIAWHAAVPQPVRIARGGISRCHCSLPS